VFIINIGCLQFDMHIKVFAFVLLIGQVECFRTLKKWNAIFNSDAKAHFASDVHISAAHDKFLSHITHESYEHANAKHPFIVQFAEKCGIECHKHIENFVGDANHQVVSSTYAQVVSDVATANSMRSRYRELIVDMVPMIPVLKVDTNTHSLADTCPAGSLINLLTVFGAMSVEVDRDSAHSAHPWRISQD
jgi:uncharacterized protein YciU (UPF0263 family)